MHVELQNLHLNRLKFAQFESFKLRRSEKYISQRPGVYENREHILGLEMAGSG